MSKPKSKQSRISPLSILHLGSLGSLGSPQGSHDALDSPDPHGLSSVGDDEGDAHDRAGADDDDVAQVSHTGTFDNYASILTSSLVYAGKGKFSALKKKLDKAAKTDGDAKKSGEQAKGKKGGNETPEGVKTPNIEYDIEESESDDESDDEEEKSKELAAKEKAAQDAQAARDKETAAHDKEEADRKQAAAKYESDLRAAEMALAALEISTKNLTHFQNSVLQNLNPSLLNESFLMKLKVSDSEAEVDTVMKAYQRHKQEFCLKIADRLKRVFDLEDDDDFLGNFNVWLVKEVLLQGHIYLTKKNILFFTFLPKTFGELRVELKSEGHHNKDDSHEIVQTGSVGTKTAKYGEAFFNTVLTHRYWAILRPETFTLYNTSTDLYFPTLVIDLKTCITAEIAEKVPLKPESGSPLESPRRSTSESLGLPDEDSDMAAILNQENYDEEQLDHFNTAAWFKVITKKKTHRFYTDSLYSARQWVNNIKKLVFQLQNSNSNNEVLMKIPIDRVLAYDRKYMFDATDNDDNPEDQPYFLSFKYFSGKDLRKHMLLTKSMTKKLKAKVPFHKDSGDQNAEKDSLNIDLIHFLIFRDGAKFQDCMLKSTEFQTKDHASESEPGHTFRRKSSHVDTEAVKSELTHIPREISTLKHSSAQNTIVDQFLNAASSNQGVSSPSGSRASTFTSPSSKGCELSRTSTSQLQNNGKMKELGRTFTNPTKLFSKKHSSTNQKSATEGSIPYGSLQEENVLHLDGLKNLEMSFEASHKNLQFRDRKHADFLEIINDQKASNVEQSKADQLTPHNMATQAAAGPTPLNLSDPSETNDSSKKKQNKLMSFGKSVKAMSFNSKGSSISHYEEVGEKDSFYVSDHAARSEAIEHFQDHFSFNNEKKLIATYYAHLQRALPIFGKVYLGENEICFRSLLPGVSTKMILPLRDVETCYKEGGLNLAYSGLVILIRGYDELFLEFSSQKARDDCEAMIIRQLETKFGSSYVSSNKSKAMEKASMQSTIESTQSEINSNLFQNRIENARLKLFEDKINSKAGLDIPIILEDSPFYKTEIKPSTSFNFTLLTIGSRGDVQPYIALAKGLMREGHKVTIATHKEFREWVEKHKIGFKEIAGNPAELMELMVKHGSISVSFLKEASSKFRVWIKELLTTSWEACQGTDILIESPSAMGGVHIAEALGIPYIRAFTMPWTRTRAYPHAFIVPDLKKGGSYNYLTHVMFETVFWKGIAGQVNKWRVNELGIPRTNMVKLAQTKIPFLYNVSPTIFPPSVDFPDWVKVTGYWFLDEGAGKDYDPPKPLLEFMDRARADNKKIVYIGFGSIVVKDATTLTQAIVDAVQSAGVRCILNKGWSDRLSKSDKPEVKLPDDIYNAGAIPHDWLFTKVDAAVHHGGSGTTGASLRGGLPTIIKPFFGDQFFYASRVEELGVGVGLKKLNVKSLAKALTLVTEDAKILEKAKKVGERIRQEDGVSSAIEAIYSELEYARTLIVAKQQLNEHAKPGDMSGTQTPISEDDYFDYDSDQPADEKDTDSKSHDDEVTLKKLDFVGKGGDDDDNGEEDVAAI